MKYIISLTAILSAIASVEAVVTYHQVIAGIVGIRKDIVAANNTINTFVPSNNVSTTFEVLKGVFALNSQILATALVANQSKPFGSNGSTAVAQAILNLDSNHIAPTLNNIVSKKARFNKGVQGYSVSFLVLDQLIRLKNSTDYLASFIVPKLDDTFRGIAPIVVETIDNQFDTAIANFTQTR